jgi:NitT/TauT family transport system substrate-binding protein
MKKSILVFCLAILALTIYLLKVNNKSTPQVLGTKQTVEKFRLGVNTWVGYGPFWLAQEKGFFQEQGLEVDITVIEDSFQRKAAVLNHSIDGLGDTVDLLVLARDQKVPSVAVMQIDLSNGADGIVSTSEINSISDLKGKKIAVQKNFVSESFLYYLLKQNGMSPEDVNIIDMEAGAAGAAFLAKQVDVAVTFEPWMSKAKERPGGKILTTSKDVNGVISDILTIDETYLKNHPEALKKFMRGWFKALDFIKSNPGESNEIMTKHYNATTAEFAELISGVYWPNLTENQTYFGTQEKPGDIYKIGNIFSEIFMETKKISERPNLTEAINSNTLFNLYEQN